MAQERRISFEITADSDPFYSESNIRYLEKKMKDYRELYQKPAAPVEFYAAGFLRAVYKVYHTIWLASRSRSKLVPSPRYTVVLWGS